jgi:hypothetical protein
VADVADRYPYEETDDTVDPRWLHRIIRNIESPSRQSARPQRKKVTLHTALSVHAGFVNWTAYPRIMKATPRRETFSER